LNTREVANNYRLSQWIEIIKECRISGQSIASWCSERGINPNSYYYWLRRVRKAACEALPSINTIGNQIVPLEVPSKNLTKFPGDKILSTSIVLHVEGVTMEIQSNACAAIIENTLRALKNVR
jgi:hypothetical protein